MRPSTRQSAACWSAGLVVLGTLMSGCSTAAPDAGPPQVVLPTLTPEERERATEDDLEQAWASVLVDFPGATRPEVELVRYVFPEEWGPTRVECLTEQGIEATYSAGQGVQTMIPDGQGESFAIAGYICAAKYPMDPIANLPLNDSQYEYVYWYFTTVLTPCLEGFGVQVENPPSLETFKETYYTEDFWSPYGSVGGDVDWEELNSDCPQSGPGLYGSQS